MKALIVVFVLASGVLGVGWYRCHLAKNNALLAQRCIDIAEFLYFQGISEIQKSENPELARRNNAMLIAGYLQELENASEDLKNTNVSPNYGVSESVADDLARALSALMRIDGLLIEPDWLEDHEQIAREIQRFLATKQSRKKS